MGKALDRVIQLLRSREPGTEEILSHEALAFVAALENQFGGRRRQVLGERTRRQARYDAGERPGFLEETRAIREGDWTVAPLPPDLQDRRVEITGPVDRKMVINALNSGARVFMADFEDSHAPTWSGTIHGQRNLFDAVRGTIEFTSEAGKRYQLNDRVATLMVRPRGWHMLEPAVEVNGHPVSASLFDFGLFFFHNAEELLARGSGPYFYLPKLESHLEARLWNDVFLAAQEMLGLPRGTIKATVLIETLPAAFELHEILWELRDHSAGLNCGRWDYIFSTIKKLRAHSRCLMPDRARITMNAPFLRAYSRAVIQACHRRGVHAMGGMAAQIPVKDDPARNRAAMARVRADKLREVRDGHDGTWVAHPALVPLAYEVFDAHMPTPNQVHVRRDGEAVRAEDLLEMPQGSITPGGVWTNVEVGLRYLESWLRGVGCVPIQSLMEDAATAEISRAQLWQWIRHPDARLSDGSHLSVESFRECLEEVLDFLRGRMGEDDYRASRFELAARLFDEMVTTPELVEFLTLAAARHLD